jgi:hypothetical protein
MVESGRITELFPQLPQEAIADAMLVMQYWYLRNINKNLPKPMPTLFQDKLTTLEDKSRGECESSSVFILYYLLKKYPEHFQNYALIQGEATNKHPLKYKLPARYNATHYNHTYFLTQDTAGTWYAGSPANFNRETKRPSFLTRVFTGPDVHTIMGSIKKADGGTWLPGSVIERELRRATKPVIHVKPSRDHSPLTNTWITLPTFNFYYKGRSRYDEEKGIHVERYQKHYMSERHYVVGSTDFPQL